MSIRPRPASARLALSSAFVLIALSSGPLARLSERADPALVLLVRHAEKATEPAGDPRLSPAGEARARALAEALAGTRITAVITTQLRRTRATAAPLAEARGITPEAVHVTSEEPADVHAAKVAAAVRRHAGGAVLVVGHSDTIPAIIAALGGPRLPDLCESRYADLFVLVPGAAEARLVRSRYGAADAEPGAGCR